MHSTHQNKMATCDFGPETVISCETALFFCIHLDYFMGSCNKQIVNSAVKRLGGGSIWGGACIR